MQSPFRNPKTTDKIIGIAVFGGCKTVLTYKNSENTNLVGHLDRLILDNPYQGVASFRALSFYASFESMHTLTSGVFSSSSLIFLILDMRSATTVRHAPDTITVIAAPVPTPCPVTLPTASAVTPQSVYATTYPSCEMKPRKPQALP